MQDIESLEAISQDEDTRNLFLRMAYLSQNGRIQPFLRELEDDGDLDAETKVTLTELACDEGSDCGLLHGHGRYNKTSVRFCKVRMCRR